jgi:hypothetical protein
MLAAVLSPLLSIEIVVVYFHNNGKVAYFSGV